VEVWKPIARYESSYEVSSLGRVRGLDRRDGKGRKIAGRVLRPLMVKGYRKVCLYSQDGIAEQLLVHRLVLSAFRGPCPNGMVGCHNDGSRDNNCVTNLRWDTSQANTLDMRRHGRMGDGEKNPVAKLRASDVERIRDMCRSGGNQSDMARMFRVSRQTITLIKQGRNWPVAV
jgi:hypothetical protein